ncbi:MAG: toll/interleukin-1 receptor domain-containing protein [Candidatus Aminicenantes bacterium]|jgi:hypothetical protein
MTDFYNGNNGNFAWEKLLAHIRNGKVIPVIGLGLYRVEIESEGESEFLLYDYLAEQILKKCNTKLVLDPDENHKFPKACLEFLKFKNKGYLELSSFLKETLVGLHLTLSNPLWKLARINNFNLFINTAYDDFLEKTIKTVRCTPTKVLSYTELEKNLKQMDNACDPEHHSKCTLVLHIFGKMKKCTDPAYTEKDILETIIQFQNDMEKYNQNNLCLKLKSSNLLFIGCGYNDWLLRFFIRSVSNKPYEFHSKNKTFNFVGDNLFDNKRHPFKELPRFLTSYKTEIFHSPDGKDFVDLLFEIVEKDKSGEIEIIPPSAFPGTVFISFEGTDRPAARTLADNLREDDIHVWLDERKFKGGDNVDETIINAIDRCRAFIPLISRNSEQKLNVKGKPKYHIQEWHQAYIKRKLKKNKVTIIPVTIDNTITSYDGFNGLYHYKIPGGCDKGGHYMELRDQLIAIQRENQ